MPAHRPPVPVQTPTQPGLLQNDQYRDAAVVFIAALVVSSPILHAALLSKLGDGNQQLIARAVLAAVIFIILKELLKRYP
jgi:ABC-type transport system involved in cytochrome bd biosynthesis fused ATPase/permease subunit